VIRLHDQAEYGAGEEDNGKLTVKSNANENQYESAPEDCEND